MFLIKEYAPQLTGWLSNLCNDMQASLFELVIDLYKYLIGIHQKDRDYGQLGECFRDLKCVCEDLVKSVSITYCYFPSLLTGSYSYSLLSVVIFINRTPSGVGFSATTTALHSSDVLGRISKVVSISTAPQTLLALLIFQPV